MDWQGLVSEHWQIKLVCLILIVAAWIDGRQLRVPNWITFPMILSGWAYHAFSGGWPGLESSLAGAAVGLLCLLPLYAVGGLGAVDVKLMAGMGAWVGASVTISAFVASAMVGGLMA